MSKTKIKESNVISTKTEFFLLLFAFLSVMDYENQMKLNVTTSSFF